MPEENVYPSITAVAGANIALIKYWGKRDAPHELNLPSTGSLSITLKDLFTTTEVSPSDGLETDEVWLNGVRSTDPRLPEYLDRIRHRLGGSLPHCKVVSTNNFPTSAGLASSASGFAALAAATVGAYGKSLDHPALSELARLGSGSAARSIFGGFVLMARGHLMDGSDAIARPLIDERQWPLDVVIAITSEQAKTHSSRVGMVHTMATSPYYPAWVEHNEQRLVMAQAAVERQDFEALADLSEASALQMHASALAAEPGVIYWHGATLDCIHRIRELRQSGVAVFFTVDAGPQVKAVCLPEETEKVSQALQDISGVQDVRCTGLGPGVRLL